RATTPSRGSGCPPCDCGHAPRDDTIAGNDGSGSRCGSPPASPEPRPSLRRRIARAGVPEGAGWMAPRGHGSFAANEQVIPLVFIPADVLDGNIGNLTVARKPEREQPIKR